MTFGRLLRRTREASGVTLADMANRLDFSVPHLCNIEFGRRNPPGDIRAEPEETRKRAIGFRSEEK